MRGPFRTIIFSALLGVSGIAQAECSVSSDHDAGVRSLNPAVKSDVDLIVSMTILPKMMHVDYRTAAMKTGCNLGPFIAGNVTYELWGEDNGGRQRKAVAAKEGAPVALVLPVVDLMKAIENQRQGRSAQVEGYLLATITKDDFTAWRYYTGMPDPATLKEDMASVLAGNGSPIFRAAKDGKTSIFMPKG